jgi:hypothetical protein
MKNFGRNDWTKLMDRIKHLNIQTLEESHDKTEGNIVNIRHDVDDDIQASFKMAQAENEIGIKSTYFILDTAPYWPQDVAKYVELISRFGHEIGWHNNAISKHIRTGESLFDCVCDALAELRKVAPVVGTASHGDLLCYERGYLNYYLFGLSRVNNLQNFPFKGDWHSFDLHNFGLKYEAYFTGHTHYITDSAGEWNQNNEEIILDFEKNGGKLQLLLHPQWWTL